MEIEGVSPDLAISSLDYSRYLTPEKAREGPAEEGPTDGRLVIESFYNSDEQGFPGAVIDLLA